MIRRYAPLFLLAASCLTAACSRRVAESLLLGDHFTRTEGVAYGEEEWQRLDVYRQRRSRELQPVVVFVHGGRWQSGSRGEYRLVGDALTRRGIVAVVPDYRKYPDATFPAWVEDAARAVAWTHRYIRQYGGDPDRIVVVGHSAGGHTAALLALDERYLERHEAAAAVRGYVILAGPVNTQWTDADVQALMGPREGWPLTYAATHIDGTEPPLLLLHGADDETVSSRNSVALAGLIRGAGGCAGATVYDDVGHVAIAVALALPWLHIAPVLRDVVAFVRSPRAVACGS